MPIHACPRCHALAPRWLEAPSTVATVNYYRCQKCGHVFTVTKDGKETFVRDVTHHPPDKRKP